MKFILILLLLIPAITFAQDAGYQGIDLQAPIGGLSRVANLGEYIAGLYRYAIVLAGVLAGIMITVGGLKWLMAAGNASVIESAKKTIFGALVGLILVFTSYIILNTINPQLVKLRVPGIRPVPRGPELQFVNPFQCVPGSRGCICRGTDPQAANVCDGSLKCVKTFFIITPAEAMRSAAETRLAANVNAVLMFIPTIGMPTAAIVSATAVGVASGRGQDVYQCSDGSNNSPCANDEGCTSQHCHDRFHLCYASPNIPGGLCEDGDDCPADTQCKQNICLGQGNKGASCHTDSDCQEGFGCFKPASQGALGKCGARFADAPQEGNFCVLNQAGSLATPESNQLQCFYCPGTGSRIWTKLSATNDPQRIRVGQYKPPEAEGDTCAN